MMSTTVSAHRVTAGQNAAALPALRFLLAPMLRLGLRLGLPLGLLLGLWTAGCRSQGAAPRRAGAPGSDAALPMRPVDQWIARDEVHFKHLWQVTFGGENTRPRWSPDGTHLAYLHSDLAGGIECDQVRIRHLETGTPRRPALNGGVQGLGGFGAEPGHLVFASTDPGGPCPAPPDHSRGYVWSLPPTYDLFAADLDSGQASPLAPHPGYDGEPCPLPGGLGLVFTSTRSGDPELWRCDPDGGSPTRITDRPGYEGAACASPDGTWIAFHSSELGEAAAPGGREALERFRATLARDSVPPGALEIALVRPDGTERHPVTALGKANWDPCFTPDGRRLVFTSNHHGKGPMPTNFDLFLVALDGSGLERVTHFDRGLGRQYDGHPRFSPDGRFLAFASNRGDGEIGETNLFIAEWK